MNPSFLKDKCVAYALISYFVLAKVCNGTHEYMTKSITKRTVLVYTEYTVQSARILLLGSCHLAPPYFY